MPRAKGGPKTRHRRKARLKMAKGYFGAKSKLFRTATEAVDKSLLYAYRDRRNKKRAFRRLWITRISAAVRNHGMTYSRFMEALSKAGIRLNRKVLAELAAHDPSGFSQIVQSVQPEKESAS